MVTGKTETAWLIETSIGGKIAYWSGAQLKFGTGGFSPDSLEAIRFIRRTDAEKIVKTLMPYWQVSVAEHQWVAP